MHRRQEGATNIVFGQVIACVDQMRKVQILDHKLRYPFQSGWVLDDDECIVGFTLKDTNNLCTSVTLMIVNNKGQNSTGAVLIFESLEKLIPLTPWIVDYEDGIFYSKPINPFERWSLGEKWQSRMVQDWIFINKLVAAFVQNSKSKNSTLLGGDISSVIVNMLHHLVLSEFTINVSLS